MRANLQSASNASIASFAFNDFMVVIVCVIIVTGKRVRKKKTCRLNDAVGLLLAGAAAHDDGFTRSGCGSWTGERIARRCRSATEHARPRNNESRAR
jgi:hypothetical protein